MEDIISYREILEHVQKQFKEDYVTSDKYKLEFDQLKAHSDALNVTQSREDGWLQYNRCKNRYKDILPYDKTRVRLPVINNIAGSDYINASHISGPDGYVNYIAAQGPLPGTVFDFWRMVWYNHSTVIVMVCKEVEMGKHKCANYWGRGPGESLKKGNFSVTLVSEQMKESYIVRKLVLTCADVSREVYQYQYLNWPDRDVPTDGEPLNKMLAIVRDKCPAKTTSESPGSPIVIHCSAGCGRTGTVLAIDFIDILIRNQRLDRNFSLFELVKRMRTERVAICQTKQQFGFVYYTAIQLLDSAIQMLNIRSEAISECIYENVPHSPTLAQEDGILVQLDSDPPPKTGPQTKPPPPPSTQPLTTTDEKLLKPSKPLKPERPRSTVGKPTDNKAETGESVNLIVQEGAANTTAAVSGDVSCGDVSCGDAVTEEPVYASVNPFAKTGKILDLDSPTDDPPPLPASPTLESDDETDPVQSLTTTVLDTHLVSDPRSKPSTMESCPPLLTPSSAPPPLTPSSAPPLLTPSSVPPPLAPYSAPPLLTPSSATPPLTRSPPTATPHIITPAVRSPLVKIRSAPPSSPTPSRQPPSSPSPLRSSLPPPSNNSTFLNSTLCSGHLIYSSSLSSFLPLAIGTQNQLSTQDDDLAYSQVFGQTNRLSSPRFDDDNYSELSIPRSDVTDSHMNTSSGDEGDEEDEDHYETFDSVVKASISKEKLEKTNSRTPSTGKKSKTKGFGFKGLLANISDNAHTASQNLKSKSQNMNIKSLTGNNNAATHQDLPNMKYESEFGKRTGSPAGPRDMPSHWIKI
ncbi:tyrosine-protein phosphatase non-receptor type 12-like isoform X8 [Bolinopsis microptera]|uniref:tyrosine-protein phosphatase non-receptor type 12-like isoform X8 n=1 Tax=Bolinopsis microptera TaxID=2820187 RepID=UPI00307A75E8